MIYSLKPVFVRTLRPLEDVLVARGVPAHAVTVASVAASAGSGIALAWGLQTGSALTLSLVPVLCFVRLAGNALDGAVARRHDSVGSAGLVVNEIGDRAGDALLLAGAAVVEPALGLAAMAASFLCSHTGVLTMSATGTRATSGPMGKADRVAVVAVAAAASIVAGRLAVVAALWLIVAGSTATAGLRCLQVVRRSGGR